MSSPRTDTDVVEAGPSREGLPRLLDLAFGFFVWAAHFLIVYVGAALACALAPAEASGNQAFTTALALATIAAAAIVVAAWGSALSPAARTARAAVSYVRDDRLRCDRVGRHRLAALSHFSGAGMRVIADILLAVFTISPADAHGPELVTPDALWRSWSFDPLVISFLLLVLWLYGRGLRQIWTRAGSGRGVTYSRTLLFTLGASRAVRRAGLPARSSR